ncbi:MAG TPA: hypothetical protein VKD91_06670 [Pyrinomonadaceae bacterium]|nr:hypothetical protein [Pyrinomonadaceae bacterium]
MAKIDRLGWADGRSFISHGVRIGLRVNDAAILNEFLARLPPGAKPSRVRVVDHLYSLTGFTGNSNGRVRRFNLGYWNLTRFARLRTFADLLHQFESHVQLTVAEYAPRRVFVHAGVVSLNGRAILIPGASYSGKTTLVTELIKAGAIYYSDEYAIIDERGRVHPYPRPLGIRPASNALAEKVTAKQIGAQIGSKPLRVGLVVSTKFKPGARWRPKELTRGKGVLELLANTVSARTQPELALGVLPKALESARILKSVRGEARDIVEAILAGRSQNREW